MFIISKSHITPFHFPEPWRCSTYCLPSREIYVLR